MKCQKVTYKDHRQALHALHLISSKGQKRQTTPVRTYECEVCGFWHITHKTIEDYLEYHSEKVELIHIKQWRILQK